MLQRKAAVITATALLLCSIPESLLAHTHGGGDDKFI